MRDIDKAIVGLEKHLRRVEEGFCYAMREADYNLAHDFYLERGEIIRKLQNLK